MEEFRVVSRPVFRGDMSIREMLVKHGVECEVVTETSETAVIRCTPEVAAQAATIPGQPDIPNISVRPMVKR